MTPIEAYIRQVAPRYRVDPNVAVRVALSEGGLNDPFRQGDAMLKYGREQSYGPFQLHMQMGGLGTRALAAGIDPRKDWQGGVDYALREASQKGWGQWYGAAKAGIGNRTGIGGGPVGPAPVGGAPTSALAGMMSPGPTAAPQMFGDLIGQNPVATTAVGPMDFGSVAANLLNSAQERDRAKAETDAAETARRVALFGGVDGSGLWGLYA